METDFTIKTQVFNGPLDLLLSLIEKRKLFINDISLGKVTDEYIRYVQSLEQFPLKDTANFILVASTLVLIKSRSILPSLTLTEDEEASIEDLEIRLKIYQKLKDVSLSLQKSFGMRPMFEPRMRQTPTVFAPGATLTPDRVKIAIQGVIANLPKPISIPQAIVKKIISLEEVMKRLILRIRQGLKINFQEVAAAEKAKAYVVVTFLAMLELVKSGAIAAEQSLTFGDIVLESREPGTPDFSAQ